MGRKCFNLSGFHSLFESGNYSFVTKMTRVSDIVHMGHTTKLSGKKIFVEFFLFLFQLPKADLSVSAFNRFSSLNVMCWVEISTDLPASQTHLKPVPFLFAKIKNFRESKLGWNWGVLSFSLATENPLGTCVAPGRWNFPVLPTNTDKAEAIPQFLLLSRKGSNFHPQPLMWVKKKWGENPLIKHRSPMNRFSTHMCFDAYQSKNASTVDLSLNYC